MHELGSITQLLKLNVYYDVAEWLLICMSMHEM